MPDEPRRPRGRARKMTDKVIDRMAEVSEEDVEEAQDWWKRNAPLGAKDLLDAEPEE